MHEYEKYKYELEKLQNHEKIIVTVWFVKWMKSQRGIMEETVGMESDNFSEEYEQTD